MKRVTIVFSGLAPYPRFATSYAGMCTTAPEEQWMTEANAQAKIAEAGYTRSLPWPQPGRWCHGNRLACDLGHPLHERRCDDDRCILGR
jgi:hypothetical protein